MANALLGNVDEVVLTDATKPPVGDTEECYVVVVVVVVQ